MPTQFAEQLQNSFGVMLMSTKPPGHTAAFEPNSGQTAKMTSSQDAHWPTKAFPHGLKWWKKQL